MKTTIKKIAVQSTAESGLIISYQTDYGTHSLEISKNGWCDLNDLDAFCFATITDYEVGYLTADEMEALAKKIYHEYSAKKQTSFYSHLTAQIEQLFFAEQNTQKQPSLELSLPSFALEVLSKEAEENRRPLENEIINRLRATFYNDIEYRTRVNEVGQSNIAATGLKKYTLPIHQDLLDLLSASARADRRSINAEVLLRLFVSFVNPYEMGLINNCESLIRKHIINEQAELERISSMAMSFKFSESNSQWRP